jgi:hypothetical protein
MTSSNDKIMKNLYSNHSDKMKSTIGDILTNNITSDTRDNAKIILQSLESQLKNAFLEDEKILGRKMTYSEMRERYG